MINKKSLAQIIDLNALHDKKKLEFDSKPSRYTTILNDFKIRNHKILSEQMGNDGLYLETEFLDFHCYFIVTKTEIILLKKYPLSSLIIKRNAQNLKKAKLKRANDGRLRQMLLFIDF